jgi:hypothetical protein
VLKTGETARIGGVIATSPRSSQLAQPTERQQLTLQGMVAKYGETLMI